MAKHDKHRQRRSGGRDRETAGQARTPTGIPAGLFWLVALFLVVACTASGLLVLEHLVGLSLPGCGKGSACAQAAASAWGKVPYINWPVAYLGFAYFFAALVAWLGAKEGVPAAFHNLVRLGAAVSVGFILVIILGGYHCMYCLGAHAGNFAFWLCVECLRKPLAATRRPLAAVVVVFVLVSMALAAVEVRQKRLVGEKNEADLKDSMAQIAAAASQKTASPSGLPATSILPDPAASTSQPAAGGPATQTSQAASDDRFPGGFTGRWRTGPQKAPVRLVMLTDYQCVDCNRIETDVRKMMSERTDVSLSIKHFPMCADCNDHFKEQNMHPNACWAARAAEAAGILRGNDGFWQMHHWLFDRKGGFTDEQLKQGLQELGYDYAQFVQVMRSPETLAPVKSDIDEGIWLGLHFTPMVFINGVELVGVFAPQAIPRAVAAAAAKNPPPMGPENDHPPPAFEKCVGDWHEAVAIRLPPDAAAWPRGSKDARIQIVMWGDYQESWTPKADAIIRKWMAGRTDVQYTFRHFPFNQACNSEVPRTAHPQACRASQAAEAAGRLGGVDGSWKMHEWLMTHQAEVNDETIRRAASEMGFNPDAFFAAMDGPEVKAAIEEDCKAGKPMLYRGSIPTIYLNRKVLPRWHLEGRPVLERILDEAEKTGGNK
jgi:protein-disulfide isomerase/uncharacterized membrane protein